MLPYKKAMLRVSSIITTLLVICAPSGNVHLLACNALGFKGAAIVTAQSPLRIGLIGFGDSSATGQSKANSHTLINALESEFKKDRRVSLIEPSLLKPALAGVGYAGSINMSKGEARRIGAAIGCDFFITGKAETVTRSERKGESHEEGYVGLMIVDGRTGALALFDFAAEKAPTRESALNQLAKTIESRSQSYVDKLVEYRARQMSIQSSGGSISERIEELPAEGSPQSMGFTPPEFMNRVKPEYTAEAERADISATVEATAVFHASGEVGEVEIIRWAGFKLDESAERAIRQLKFKPAMRDGKLIGVRATVQYNFRRKSGRE
jgi:TonB family protein